MDHPEVRAWMEDAVLQAGGLERPADAEVAAHLETCAACDTERRALQATAVAIDLTIGPSRGARERVLANVRLLGRERRRTPPAATTADWRAWQRMPARRAAFALLGLAVLMFTAGALTATLLRRDDPAPGRLASAAVEMADLVRDSDTRQVALLDRAGAPAGLVLHSATRDRLVVMTSALEPPTSGRYSCFLERDGERRPIGPMHFVDRTAFWAGPMGGPADAGRAGDRFVVVLDPSDGVPALAGEF